LKAGGEVPSIAAKGQRAAEGGHVAGGKGPGEIISRLRKEETTEERKIQVKHSAE